MIREFREPPAEVVAVVAVQQPLRVGVQLREPEEKRVDR